MRGEWQEAERLATQPGDVPLESAAQARGIQVYEAMKLRGEWESLAGLVRWNLNQEPRFVGWQVALATISSLQGKFDGIPEAIDRWAVDDFSALPLDFLRLPNLCMIAELCAMTEHSAPALRLYEILAPYRDRFAVIRVTAGVLGSVSRYLGLLAGAQGDWERATVDFESALEAQEQLGARPYQACTRFDYAAMLTRAGREPELARAQLRAAEEEALALGMTWLAERCNEARSALA